MLTEFSKDFASSGETHPLSAEQTLALGALQRDTIGQRNPAGTMHTLLRGETIHTAPQPQPTRHLLGHELPVPVATANPNAAQFALLGRSDHYNGATLLVVITFGHKGLRLRVRHGQQDISLDGSAQKVLNTLRKAAFSVGWLFNLLAEALCETVELLFHRHQQA